jgi:hypothetical protein
MISYVVVRGTSENPRETKDRRETVVGIFALKRLLLN